MLALAVAVALAAAAPPPCTHGQLTVRHAAFEGSAGHFHWPIVFTNTSGRACTLRGFPGVSSVTGRHGARIGEPAVRDRSRPVRTVRLAAHGGRATALFTETDVGVFPRRACRPRRAQGLRVYAPGQFR